MINQINTVVLKVGVGGQIRPGQCLSHSGITQEAPGTYLSNE